MSTGIQWGKNFYFFLKFSSVELCKICQNMRKYGSEKTRILATAWKVSKHWVFQVRIFPYLDWILRFTPLISVFSLNVGKYRPENSVFGQFLRSLHSRNSRILIFYQMFALKSSKFSGKHVLGCYFNKFGVSRPATLFKENSSTSTFLINLWHFSE